MVKPTIRTRPVKPDDLQVGRQNSGYIRTFGAIAQNTGARKIIWIVAAIMFLADNMFDLVRQVGVRFVQ